MEKKSLSNYFFIIILLVTIYLTYIIIKPFFKYVVLAVVLGYTFYPIYFWLAKKTRSQNLAASMIILLVLVILIIPTIFVVGKLVRQTSGIWQISDNVELFDRVDGAIAQYLGQEVKVQAYVVNFFANIKGFLVDKTPNLLGSVAEIFLGLFVMFFVMFYTFKHGKQFFQRLLGLLPMKIHHKKKLFLEMKSVTRGVIYGQVLTALIQGTIGGLGFLIFGLPDPIFWGFIMIILSFLPVVGTPLIWLPAGIIQIAQGDLFSGIGIIAFGAIVISNIDNILRPKIIERFGQVHPVIALLGVLGGLKVWGFIGILIGPLVLAVLILLISFYGEYLEMSMDEE